MAIFDAAGRRVREWAWPRLAAGKHVVRWDARDAAGAAVRPGLYFLRFEASGRVARRRVVVVE